MTIRILKLILLFSLLDFPSFSQQGGEVLVDLASKPIYIEAEYEKNIKQQIKLPFFDDFSWGKNSPMPSLWQQGADVYVNTTYPINPITVGVATFDALNYKGELHHNASINIFSADTLMSRPIDMFFPSDTTIYFSFNFQPEGLGNRPDPRDSLVLEFYDPQNMQWVGVWAAWAESAVTRLYQHYKLKDTITVVEGEDLNKKFHRVHFSILDSRFLTSDFQFRFRNYASLSENSDVPSLRSNSDHWHINLLYLNHNRSYKDTIIDDVAFYKPLGSILNTYESIPWLHFNEFARAQELPSQLGFTINYRNLGEETRNVTRRFSVYNHSTNDSTNFTGGALNINPFEDITYTRTYSYPFESAWDSVARFTFTSYLMTGADTETQHLRWNDTLRYVQRFENYYAYDDGTAESGYGLFGEGTQNGMVAVKFNNFKADWLVGVYMYFNRTHNDANQKFFRLMIWDDNNGRPGNIVYEQLGLRPEFPEELNRFTLFKLKDELWLEPGTFYIGWMKTTTDMLNVGFDRNRVSNRLFYNWTGNWQTSSFDGSLMIRPVFGQLTEPPTSVPYDAPKVESLNIYPNPAQNFFSIGGAEHLNELRIEVFSVTGQKVMSVAYRSNPIDVSRLPRGMYIVRMISGSRIIGTEKLIIGQ